MADRLYPLKREVFDCVVLPFIKHHRKRGGHPPRVGDYEFFCGVLYVLRTGVSWRNLPACFGPWHTIYTRYKRWSASGFFWRLLDHLQSLKKLCVDVVFVDGSLVPLHRHGSGAPKK
jgi:transposase